MYLYYLTEKMKKIAIILTIFGIFFSFLFFGKNNNSTFANSNTQVSLRIIGTYTGNIVLDTTNLTLKNGKRYTQSDTLSFFVTATDTSDYKLNTWFTGISGTGIIWHGTGDYTIHHTIALDKNYYWKISFSVIFNKSWEKRLSNILSVIREKKQNIIPTPFPWGWNLGWGWGAWIHKDFCPKGDRSLSYYDRICWYHGMLNEDELKIKEDKEIKKEKEQMNFALTNSCINYMKDQSPAMNKELLDAYQFAIDNKYLNDKFCTIIDEPLSRIRMAEIMSLFAVNVLKEKQKIFDSKCKKFKDINTLKNTKKIFTQTSCELGLMGLRADGIHPKEIFEPHKFVSRAEFGTVLSRLLFKKQFAPKQWQKRYESHLNILFKYNILTNINPNIKEKTPWVLLMLYRIKNQEKIEKIIKIEKILKEKEELIKFEKKINRQKEEKNIKKRNTLQEIKKRIKILQTPFLLQEYSFSLLPKILRIK